MIPGLTFSARMGQPRRAGGGSAWYGPVELVAAVKLSWFEVPPKTEAEAKQKLNLWLSSHFVCKYATFIKKILYICVGERLCMCVCVWVCKFDFLYARVRVCVCSHTFCGWNKSNLLGRMFLFFEAPKRHKGVA